MSKTYIYGPITGEFLYVARSGILSFTPDSGISDSFDFTDSIFEIDGHPIKLKYAGSDSSGPFPTFIFTENGVIPETMPEVFGSIIGDHTTVGGDSFHGNINVKSPALPTENCTLTVSIYKEEGEDDTTPETIAKLSKNVTYELHPHNDIDRIRFKGNLTNKESEEDAPINME